MRNAKRAIIDWLAGRGVGGVDEVVVAALEEAFPDCSARTMRLALLESGLKLAPEVEGVNQHSLDDAARTLDQLAGLYAGASPERARAIRRMVITAKTHARFAARNRRIDEETRAVKEEILLWISTWLENPPLFAAWLKLRRRAEMQTEEGDGGAL